MAWLGGGWSVMMCTQMEVFSVASAQFSGSMKLETRSRALASFKCRLGE